MKLDRHCPVGLQEFQQFIVGPFQVVLLREKTKDGNDPDNLSAGLQNYACRQVLLVGQERSIRLALLKLAHALLHRAPEQTGAAQERLQRGCFNQSDLQRSPQ